MNPEWTSDYQRLYGAPLTRPEQAQQFLRDPQKHWKKGRSAYEAAHAWIGAGGTRGVGLPARVRELGCSTPEWQSISVVSGFFEHATPLDTQSGPSNTDILVVCGLKHGLGILAVEAKAGEPFGDLVRDWRAIKPSPGKDARLASCRFLAVQPETCDPLRWQLFHRTASAVIEAQRFRANHAIMLVHDFCENESWAADYESFAKAIGIADARVGGVSEPRTIQGISLRLGWVRDQPWP
jgi:hypothetical protein